LDFSAAASLFNSTTEVRDRLSYGCITTHGNRIPAAVAEMIARAAPQPGDNTIANIRKRMQARHRSVLPND
jgi:hypothetical protein